MSSPMSSLKKNKVPLFPGHMSGNRPIPFRHPEYSEDESRLLAEITTQMIQEKRKRSVGLSTLAGSLEQPSLLGRSVGSQRNEGEEDTSPPPSDHELMRLMMNRVALLEQQTQTQAEELRVKERQIKVLEDKLRIAGKARGEDSHSNGTKDLESHCLLLQQQVHEMETFLAEYGMVWVGEQANENSNVYLEDGEEDDDENNNLTETSLQSDSPGTSITSSNPFGMWRQSTSVSSDPVPLDIDFNRLVENINDLNVLAGAGVAQIKKTSDGARFEIPESVQLTLYANGILMFDGPFRPYTDPATLQCVQDLLDGYFPSELQSRYPDGVPFLLTDLRGTHFQPSSSLKVFAGDGRTLGGDVRPSRLIPTNFRDPTKNGDHPGVGQASQTTKEGGQPMVTTSVLPGKQMTPTQFLNKLPKCVIKDGKVIDVRDSVGKTLTGADTTTAAAAGSSSSSKPNVTLINTNVTKEMSDSVVASTDITSPLERPKSYKGHGDVTTLRVVTENGEHTYILKMKFKETVGNLRTYLDTQRRPSCPYDIVSTFPHKVHNNNTMTLEASGLTPNAVLHLRPCKK